MSYKVLLYFLLTVEVTVLLFGCANGLLDTPAAPNPNPTNTNETTPSTATKETIQYCGAQLLPPWKKVVCEKFCKEATCQNFYCECQGLPPAEKNCTTASDAGKCARHCKRSNLAVALHCPTSASKYYCICS